MRRIITNASKKTVEIGPYSIEPIMSITLSDDEISESMWNQIEALSSVDIIKVTSCKDFAVPEIIAEEIIEQPVVEVVEEIVEEEPETQAPIVEEVATETVEEIVEEEPANEPEPTEPKKRTRKTTKSE